MAGSWPTRGKRSFAHVNVMIVVGEISGFSLDEPWEEA